MAEAPQVDGLASDQAAILQVRSPTVALQHRDFRIYWAGQFVSTVGSMMQQAAIAWQVYLLTHSALALGLIGLFRVVPIVLLSLVGGVLADAIDRRKLLIATQSLLLVAAAVLSITTLSHSVSIWLIYGLTAVVAGTLAFDSPARQAFLPSMVPPQHLPNALSLNSVTMQAGMVLGPSLAGVVIAASGVAAVYAINAASFLAVLVALLIINPPRVRGDIPRISLAAAVEGLRFVRRTPILLSTMMMDFVATFFSSATALLPIFARDILHVGSLGYGALYASPAVGAILASLAMTFYAGSIRNQGRVILLAVAIYGACTLGFGLSRIFAVSLVMLAGTGAADTVSMILRQTVRQLVTPDALRGRMTSVSMVFFMGGPQLGEFEAGVVARALTAQLSVISGGLATLLVTALIAWKAAGLRGYRHEP
jgi:MFS family permease